MLTILIFFFVSLKMAKLLILDGNMVTKFDYEANAKVARGRSNAEGSERGRETTEAASQARRRGGRRPYSPCLRTSSSSSSSSSSSKPQPIPQLHPSSSSSSSVRLNLLVLFIIRPSTTSSLLPSTYRVQLLGFFSPIFISISKILSFRPHP